MKNLYSKLYTDCCRTTTFQTDEPFVGMQGSQYRNENVRFLLIGRATNGWMHFKANTLERFGEVAEQQFFDNTRFSWIESRHGKLYNHASYCLDNKAFWTYTREIWQNLSGKSADGVWMENIAWTNLYKLAPGEQGNPSTESIQQQLPVCRDILQRELEELDPTHILFITGYDWFADFANLFTDVSYYGQNILRGRNKNNIYAEATAKFHNAKVVVACRPEYRNKSDYINQVIEKYEA